MPKKSLASDARSRSRAVRCSGAFTILALALSWVSRASESKIRAATAIRGILTARWRDYRHRAVPTDPGEDDRGRGLELSWRNRCRGISPASFQPRRGDQPRK